MWANYYLYCFTVTFFKGQNIKLYIHEIYVSKLEGIIKILKTIYSKKNWRRLMSKQWYAQVKEVSFIVYTYIKLYRNIYVHIYMYIYFSYTHIYIYIYLHIHIYIHIYIKILMTQHTSVFTYTAASMLEPLYISLPGSQRCS